MCKKKLRLAQRIECKCGGLFCPLHRAICDHNCTFDYLTENKKKLERKNPKIQAAKVISF
jgi:hypothetical protein